jgi:4-amino-4-deoxy-L-arabinose transferase-like glycosyltransferase
MRKNFLIIILALFGITGMAIIWLNTPWGIGVGYDSIFYISAADNLMNGLGLSRLDGFGLVIPLTHFPPLYPLTLASLSFLTGLEIEIVARVLAALSFGFLAALMGWLIFTYTHSRLAGVLGAALALVAPILLEISFMAMTETLFLVALLLMLYNLNRYLSTEENWQLWAAAGLAATAYLLRYVGLTVILVGVIALLIFGRKAFRRKLRDAILFAGIGILPMAVYYLRNWNISGSFTNRAILYHPPTADQIRAGLATISAWIMPTRFDLILRLILLTLFGVTLGVLFVLNLQRNKSETASQDIYQTGHQFVLLLVLFIVTYLASLILSLTFFDASTRLNNRILSPVYVSGVIAGFVLVWQSTFYQEYGVVRAGVVAAVLIFIGVNLVQGTGVANQMRVEGKGFSGKAWRTSETIDLIKELPQDAIIYTNEAFAVYFLTGKSANWIPENFDPVKGQPAEDYNERVAAMWENIYRFNGALVIFDSISKTNVYAPIEQLTHQLTLWSQGADGAIYLTP